MKQDKHELANQTFGTILSNGFSLYGKTFFKIIIPFALFSIIPIFLNIFLLAPLRANLYDYYLTHKALIDEYFAYDPYSQENPFSPKEIQIIVNFIMTLGIISFLETIPIAIFGSIAFCSISLFLYTTYTKGKSDLILDLKTSLSNKYIVYIIILGVTIFVCFSMSGILMEIGLFFYIPGVLLFCYYIFLIFTYNFRNLKTPAREARLIARGQSMRIIGAYLISCLITGLFIFILNSIYIFIWPYDLFDRLSWNDPSRFNFGMLFLDQLLNNIALILITPLFICFLTVLFVSAQARKELGYFAQKQEYVSWESKIDRQPQERRTIKYEPEVSEQIPLKTIKTIKSTTIPKQRRGGLYCPFCGYHIRSPKKYCPECGEEVNLDLK